MICLIDWFDWFILKKKKAVNFVEQALAEFDDSTETKANFKPEKGRVYAGYFEDEQWHRVRVEAKLTNQNYLVHFIDFGNVN